MKNIIFLSQFFFSILKHSLRKHQTHRSLFCDFVLEYIALSKGNYNLTCFIISLTLLKIHRHIKYVQEQ
jgi:hypothetical protein